VSGQASGDRNHQNLRSSSRRTTLEDAFRPRRLPETDDPQLVVVVAPGHVAPVASLFDAAPRSAGPDRGGDELLSRVRDAARDVDGIPLDGLTFGPAVNEPPIVLAVGLNYAAHSSELGLKADTAPTGLRALAELAVRT
jgi:hypothetical protein